MLIVYIMLTPLAGAPIRIADALNKFTDYNVRVINLNPNNYGTRTFKEDLIWDKNTEQCIELLKQADILHFHHYIDLNNNPFGVNFNELMKPGCKVVKHFHSVFDFWTKCNPNFQFLVNEDKSNKLVVAHCAERTFLDILSLPNIIPINDSLLIPKETNNKKVKVVYSVSNKNSCFDERWETKGYKEVHPMLLKLSKKLSFDYELICDVPYEKAIEIKQNADIIIGDIVTGSYHLTELEGLCQGKVVLCNLDPRTVLNCANVLGCKDIPFVNCNLKILEPVLKKLIEDEKLREEISAFSRCWIEKYYSDEFLAQKFAEFYNKILDGEKITRENSNDYKLAKQFLYNKIYDYSWEMDKLNKNLKIPMIAKKNIPLIQNLFSIKNEVSNDCKRKVIRILGLKFSIKIKKNNLPLVVSNSNDLNILVYISGGFGDFLINANYLYYFSKYIEKEKNNIKIDIAAKKVQFESLKATFSENSFIDNYYVIEEFVPKVSYDLKFWLHSHVQFDNYDLEKIKRLNIKLFNFIVKYLEFKKSNEFFAFYHTNSYHIALAKNQHRLQLADIDGMLGVEKEFKYPIPYPELKTENEILEKFNVKNRTFITFNRGIDKNSSNAESTKMWSLEHTQNLIDLLKQKYPDILIVQLGASVDRCTILNNIDVNLVGKTDLQDIKVLIKSSILHIDCEGGFAHLRNALKAPHPAIIIFGPTNPDLYGYDTNINIKNSKACSICCDWIVPYWQGKCLRGYSKAPCTDSISAIEVFNKADEYLIKNYNTTKI